MKVGHRLAVVCLTVAAVALVVAGCGVTSEAGQSFAVASIGPGRTVSPAINATRAELVRALGQHKLVLSDTQSPVRPAEFVIFRIFQNTAETQR